MTNSVGGGLLAQLGADRADIVLAYPERASEKDRALARALLDDGERLRADRYRFERDRELFIFSRAFLRKTLARYLDAEPGKLRFIVSPGGRPELDVCGFPSIRFNLSHTNGLVACIITSVQDCGIDAEIMRPVDDDVIASVLTKSEKIELMALNAEQRLGRFYELWTLKEAYAKGRGLGLAIPLQHLDFSICEEAWSLSIAQSLMDDSQAWRFWSSHPTAQHRVSAALRVAGRMANFRFVETDGLS